MSLVLFGTKELLILTRKEVDDMAVTEDRFERIYKQGIFSGVEIWMDKATGVNYMLLTSGGKTGLTVLVNEEGKPIINDTNKFDYGWMAKELNANQKNSLL